jgi:quercetin dioxygenase-like cupin family protein
MLGTSSLKHRGMRTLAAIFVFATVLGAEWDPSAIKMTLPKDIPWVDNGKSATAILAGDPNKPGLYVELTKWHAGNMSRPHFHPNDRYIYVIQGTWWVGTGTKYDPDHTVPMPTGSYVVHPAKGVHYDGAKDADCIIEIVGMGPATSTPAEVK